MDYNLKITNQDMRINGFLGVSLIDYPGNITAIVYTSPCNFRCPSCHNSTLIYPNKETFGVFDVIKDIIERKKLIDAVSITGGEPTMQRGLINFMKEIKSAGLKIKLDTNGFLPGQILKIVNEGLVDYIAMDIKTSPEKYEQAAGIKVDFDRIRESINIIMRSNIKYEFRTTAVPGVVDKEDIEKIAYIIRDAEMYVIQQFSNTNTFDEKMKDVVPYSEAVLKELVVEAEKHVKKVKIYNVGYIT